MTHLFACASPGEESQPPCRKLDLRHLYSASTQFHITMHYDIVSPFNVTYFLTDFTTPTSSATSTHPLDHTVAVNQHPINYLQPALQQLYYQIWQLALPSQTSQRPSNTTSTQTGTRLGGQD
eukprot:5607855-Amphidinium_carterae.1